MKKFVLALLLMVLMLPLSGYTLKGKLEYTVESAREEAFDGVLYKIPVSSFSRYLTDPDYASNKALMARGVTETGDRWIERYSDGIYGIVFKADRYKVYNYKPNGTLEFLEIRSSLDCPSKTYTYNSKGELLEISFFVSLNDIYQYDMNGKFVSHWVGKNCYDINGKIILKKLD